MITIKSFEDALKKSDSQVNAENLLNGRMNIKGVGWTTVTLSPEFLNTLVDSIIEILGGRGKHKDTMRFKMRNTPVHHWGLQRFIVEQYNDKPAFISYCAGQDYPSELAEIGKYLR